MELEVFVHGALCMAYSGRCLLSGYINRRDPNQGTCTNACRWEYKAVEGREDELGNVVAREPTWDAARRPSRYSSSRKATVPANRWPPSRTNTAPTS